MLNSKVKQFIPKQEKVVVPKSHLATVNRVDSAGTVWVTIDGGAPETPCVVTSVDVKPGDRVQVTIQDHRAYVNGNTSRPATDDTTASNAQRLAGIADAKAIFAQAAANAANAAANKAMARAIEANEAAGTAKETADAAVSAANLAESTAIGAMSAASAATDAAEDAIEAAAVAQGNASSALSTAGEANDVASTAVAKAAAIETMLGAVNLRINEGDDETLVRAFGNGVLIGKVNKNPCALVDAEGHFDVVVVDWMKTTLMDSFGKPIVGDDGKPKEKWVAIGITRTLDKFGETTIIGDEGGMHLSIDATGIYLMSGDVPVAQIAGESMSATRVSVTESLRVNNWRFMQSPNGNLAVKWRE